jgi:hypothetical protein
MARRPLVNSKSASFSPDFADEDWAALKTWAQSISEALSDVTGTGQDTRGYGTYILNRLWPRSSTQKDGLLTKIMQRALLGLYTVNTDETTTANVVYVGLAHVGTATSAAGWMMMEFYDLAHAEDPYKMRLCDGNELFDNIWDNRATVTYKEVRLDDRNEVVSTED